MLDRYTTGLLAVQNACARKNLDLSVQTNTFCLQLREIHELAPVVNPSWMMMPEAIARRASVLLLPPFIG
jgi:hypothetical protein